MFEDGALWRLRYPVLDRTGDSVPARVMLLEDVAAIELRFLGEYRCPARRRSDAGRDAGLGAFLGRRRQSTRGQFAATGRR